MPLTHHLLQLFRIHVLDVFYHHNIVLKMHQCPIYASVNQVIIISDDGLPPDRLQAIICKNPVGLSSGTSGTNVCEIWIKYIFFHWTKFRLKNGRHFVSASMCWNIHNSTYLATARFARTELYRISVGLVWLNDDMIVSGKHIKIVLRNCLSKSHQEWYQRQIVIII